MYEAVHARPDGDSTVARHARTAASVGYDGIVVRNHGDERCDFDPTPIRDEYGIDVVEGIEVRADGPRQASGFIGNYRREYTILAVHGGTNELNRFACEQPRVDVLCHPMRGSGDFNHVLARAANENGVRIEFNLRGVLRSAGGTRVQVLQDLRKLREIVEQYDTPFVVSADPSSHLHLRPHRELVALGERIGFDGDQIREGLREWGRLADRNRYRSSDEFIEPGVRRGRYEEDD